MMSYAVRDLLRYQTEESMEKHKPEDCLKDENWIKKSNSTCDMRKLKFEAPGAMVGRNG